MIKRTYLIFLKKKKNQNPSYLIQYYINVYHFLNQKKKKTVRGVHMLIPKFKKKKKKKKKKTETYKQTYILFEKKS